MTDGPTLVESVLEDQQDLLINTWKERMFQHPDSNFEPGDLPELDRICRRGLAACLALLRSEQEPNLKAFVRQLADKRRDWGLEAADLLRFFWELREAVEDVLTRGGDPGRPDWREVHDELNRCIEVGVFDLMTLVENEN